MAARSARLIVLLTALLSGGTSLSGLPRGPEGSAPPTQTSANRIISLVPALTEMVYAIGAGPQVIAVSSYDEYPPEVLKLPRVGALLDPDTERILAMRPDVVLLYGSQEQLRDVLQRAGIGTFMYRHGGLADITATIRRLGELTGHARDADRVAANIDRRLDEIRARVERRPRPRTMLIFGREPLTLRNMYATGGRGFAHEVLETAGGDDVFADVPRENVHVSTEMLLARAPEAIVELRVGEPPLPDRQREERAVWQAVGSVPAVKNGRVYLLYGDHLVVPGPRIAQAAEEIARVLHPDAFK